MSSSIFAVDAFEIEDIFSLDQISQQRLDEISARIQGNDHPRLFDYVPQADEHQQRFIDSQAETIRLLAPAGSGKTQSIVNRVLREVSRGKRLDDYLILTFDNAAAVALRQRFATGLQDLGQSLSGQARVQTLNAFGSSLLSGLLSNRYGRLTLGANPPSTRREAMHQALEEVQTNRPDAAWMLPRNLSRKVYLDLVSRLKNNLITPEGLFSKTEGQTRDRFFRLCDEQQLLDPWLVPLIERGGDAHDQHTLVNLLCSIYRRYEVVMRENGWIDFDDQKLLPYLALSQNPALTGTATAGYGCVIVDEFQDINLLDFELIRLLSKNKRLVVVGDDDQAIYAFRGCSPGFIREFPEMIGREVETQTLRINYRCPANVVEMAGKLISYNTQRIEKNQVAHRADLADVHVWQAVNSASEAQVIARFIRQLIASKAKAGLSYSDIAILVRMNSQSLPLQLALILQDIPYHCRQEDNVLLSETMEKLMGLLALHLKLVENQRHHCREDTELLCDCAFRYVAKAQVETFHRLVEASGGYREAITAACSPQFPHRQFGSNDLRKAVDALMQPGTPEQLVRGIADHFRNLGGLVGSLEQAIDNFLPLGEMVDIAGRFRGDVRDFHGRLNELLGRVRGGLYRGEQEGDAVGILTYFRAKGRQWHSVILPGVNQRVMPNARSPVEEERRLFYVAVTRATSNLVLSYVRQAVRCKVEPSQFLGEMGLGTGEDKRAAILS